MGLPAASAFGFTRCQVASMISGAAFLGGLAVTLLCLPLIRGGVHGFLLHQFSLAPNTLFTSVWKDVPVTPKIEVYVFNVTNHDAYLSGRERKISVAEIGPFVYHAKQTKDVQGYSVDGEEITFKSMTSYSFMPGESVADELQTRVIVPNIVLFTGMAKPDVAVLPKWQKEVAWSSVLSTVGRREAFLQLTVNEFLFGYEDELACLEGDAAAEDEDSGGDWGFGNDDGDDWGFSDKEAVAEAAEAPTDAGGDGKSHRVRPKQNYRRPDGRCLVGALERMNATWDETITMKTGKSDLRQKGRLVSVEGLPQLDLWQPGSTCDVMSGDQDATALPALSPERRSMDLYLDIICRTVHLVEDQENEASYFGGRVEARKFEADENSFNDTANHGCYEQSEFGLKEGAMVVSKCQEGAPVAFTFPHFMHADPWYIENIDGVTPPDPQEHSTMVEVDPALSTPITIKARFQLNLIVRKDSAFPPLQGLPLAEGEVAVLPMLWASEGFHMPDEQGFFPLYLALNAPDVVTVALPLALLLAAVLCLLVPVISWKWKLRRSGANGGAGKNFASDRKDIYGDGLLETMPLRGDSGMNKNVQVVSLRGVNAQMLQ